MEKPTVWPVRGYDFSGDFQQSCWVQKRSMISEGLETGTLEGFYLMGVSATFLHRVY